VSRQILALEEALGLKLLVRGHRSIAFTPEGERLFRSADSAVQQLQDVVHALTGPTGRRRVTLTSTIGVTGLWLMPRLGAFLQQHPDIEVRVSANSRAMDLQAEGIDLAIRYGAREAMPAGAERLFGEEIVPVAHPSLGLQALSGPEVLRAQVLLEFDGPYRPWLQWSHWLERQGWKDAPARGVLRFNQYDQLIHAAVAAQGIALGRRALIAPMLADGRLVALGPAQAAPAAYWLLQAAAEPAPQVRELTNWLRAEAAACAG
jgi:DNA-binding transcriptional LysR family regulator